MANISTYTSALETGELPRARVGPILDALKQTRVHTGFKKTAVDLFPDAHF